MPKDTRIAPQAPAVVTIAAPRIGDVVLYQCKQASQTTPSQMAAIIQHVVDPAKRVVHLTIFTDAGPVMKRDVVPWTTTTAEGWAVRS